MTRYRYSVISPDGRKRIGHIEAHGKQQAEKLILASDDLLIELEVTSARKRFKLERKQTVSEATAAEFGLELSGLLSAGAPLRRALDIQSEGKTQTAILAQNVRRRIDTGLALSEALEEAGGSAVLLSEFSAAGEAGAGLERLLASGARFLNARQQAVSELKNALAYPLFIVLLALVALTVITIFVAPALAPTLEDAGQGGIVLWLAKIGTWAQSHSSLFLVILAGLISLTFFTASSKLLKNWVSRLIWRSPFLGGIVRDLDTGQSCNVMSALLEAGRPLESALRFAAAVSSTELSKTYQGIALRLRDGEVASVAFSTSKALPIELRRLAVLGEQSSTLGRAIAQAGDLCHARALRRIHQLANVAGPALVIGLGLAIAGLMLSILGSLSSIGETVL